MFMVPKPRTLADIEAIDAELTRLEGEYGHPTGGVGLLLISTETAQGVLNLPTFTQCPRVTALSWGAEDLSAALGSRRNRDENGELPGRVQVLSHPDAAVRGGRGMCSRSTPCSWTSRTWMG
jgi:citrate lyase beta subunit